MGTRPTGCTGISKSFKAISEALSRIGLRAGRGGWKSQRSKCPASQRSLGGAKHRKPGVDRACLSCLISPAHFKVQVKRSLSMAPARPQQILLPSGAGSIPCLELTITVPA